MRYIPNPAVTLADMIGKANYAKGEPVKKEFSQFIDLDSILTNREDWVNNFAQQLLDISGIEKKTKTSFQKKVAASLYQALLTGKRTTDQLKPINLSATPIVLTLLNLVLKEINIDANTVTNDQKKFLLNAFLLEQATSKGAGAQLGAYSTRDGEVTFNTLKSFKDYQKYAESLYLVKQTLATYTIGYPEEGDTYIAVTEKYPAYTGFGQLIEAIREFVVASTVKIFTDVFAIPRDKLINVQYTGITAPSYFAYYNFQLLKAGMFGKDDEGTLVATKIRDAKSAKWKGKRLADNSYKTIQTWIESVANADSNKLSKSDSKAIKKLLQEFAKSYEDYLGLESFSFDLFLTAQEIAQAALGRKRPRTPKEPAGRQPTTTGVIPFEESQLLQLITLMNRTEGTDFSNALCALLEKVATGELTREDIRNLNIIIKKFCR